MDFRPLPFTLRQLQYVLAIVETGSFRGAAERCAVSQPSLSAQVAEVEAALGVVLFERDRRRVLVTKAGEAVVERARRILLEAADLAEAAQRHADPLAGTLRIGVIPTVGPWLLPHAAPLLREAFPHLSFVWVEEKTATLLERIEAGSLDGAIVAAGTEGPGLRSLPLGSDPFLLALPPGHRLAKGRKRATPDLLDHETVLLLDEGHCLREQALALCSDAASESEFRATSLPTLVQMVAGGLGVTLLPAIAAQEATRAGLLLLPFAPPAPRRELVLTIRPHAARTEALEAIAARLAARWQAFVAR